VAGHATRIELVLEPGNRSDDHRQRPRHPGRSAPQISRQVGAGGDPHHAAFRRQVQRQGLCHLWRAAWRRRQRWSMRSLSIRRSRSRATASCSASVSRSGHPQGALEKIGAAPNRRGTIVAFTADARSLARRALQAGAAVTSWRGPRPICSRASRSAGNAILRSSSTIHPPRRCSSFPAALPIISPSRSASAQCVTKDFSPAQEFAGATPGRAEWAVAWPLVVRWQLQLVLQHHPDPGWRHPRGGPARRADQGHPRLRRAGRASKKAKDITADDVMTGAS
jgi:topoisomerase-4 subunit B